MSKFAIGRVIAVLSAAVVLFGLQHGLGAALYVAFPVALVVYMAIKVAIGLLWGADERT